MKVFIPLPVQLGQINGTLRLVRTAILENSIKCEVLRVKGTSLVKSVDKTLVKAEKSTTHCVSRSSRPML